MDRFVGKWEQVPALTENFDGFCDKMGIPAEQREHFRNMVAIVTVAVDGDTMISTLEIKGQTTKQEQRFKLGVPLDYTGLEGSKMNTCIRLQGEKLVEKHKSEKDGVTREWDVERFVEGDMMIAISSKEGVSMKSKMKRI